MSTPRYTPPLAYESLRHAEPALANLVAAVLKELRPELARRRLDYAVLYATSAGVQPTALESPVAELRRRKNKAGKSRQAALGARVQEAGRRWSEERIFFLPGKIPISRLKALTDFERSDQGRIMLRRMLRGHWRRANPSWEDQALRWIEPYWKGPEMGAIIEKEYKLIP